MKKQSLFVEGVLLTMITRIRDRIVHDGYLDTEPRVYEVYKKRKYVELSTLIPDMTNGLFDNFRGRQNFYGNERKINLELPEIVSQFHTMLIVTLETIGTSFDDKVIQRTVRTRHNSGNNSTSNMRLR
jgi:hypothetical protein